MILVNGTVLGQVLHKFDFILSETQRKHHTQSSSSKQSNPWWIPPVKSLFSLSSEVPSLEVPIVVEAVMAFVVAEASLEEKSKDTKRIRPELKKVLFSAIAAVRHALMSSRSLQSPWKNRKNVRNYSSMLIRRKRRIRRSSHAVTLPEFIANLLIILLGDSCGMVAGVVVGVIVVRVI